MVFLRFFCILVGSVTSAQISENAVTLDLADEIFLLTNNKVDETVEKIFEQLGQPQASNNTKILKELILYKDLQNTQTINYKFFKKIANISKIAPDKETDFDKALAHVVKSLNISDMPLSKVIMNTFKYLYPTIQKHVDEDENLSMEFIKDLIIKVDALSVDDFRERKKIPSKLKFTDGSHHEEQKKTTLSNMVNEELAHWEAPTETESSKNKSRRLYFGETVAIKMFPFMASLYVDDVFVCGGSIISADVVISAASCLSKIFKQAERGSKILSNLTVRIGSDYTQKDGFVVKASQANFHPDFDMSSFRNNLVIITLKKFDVNKIKWIKRVRFEKEYTDIYHPDKIDKAIRILGWGVRDKKDPQSETPLSEDKLGLYDLESCKNIYGRYFVTPNHFCAGSVLKGAGACNKDVGGPGLYSGTLVGVVSFGSPECGLPDSPTVFTRIAPYAKWIQRNIEEVDDKNKVISKTIPRKTTKTTKKNKPHETPSHKQQSKEHADHTQQSNKQPDKGHTSNELNPVKNGNTQETPIARTAPGLVTIAPSTKRKQYLQAKHELSKNVKSSFGIGYVPKHTIYDTVHTPKSAPTTRSYRYRKSKPRYPSFR